MTILYPDLSNNNWTNNEDVIDFLLRAKSEGLTGAVHKVSQGSDFQDVYWPVFRTWCEQNDYPWIGFHYIDTSDPMEQARNFVANDGGPFAMLDFEAGSGTIGNFWSVVNAFNSVGVNVTLSYDPHWYNDEIYSPDLSNFPANQISLVSSNYAWQPAGIPADIYNALGGDTGPGWQSYGGVTPTVWQFSQMASIGGRAVDCNAYRGTNLNDLFTGNVFNQGVQ